MKYNEIRDLLSEHDAGAPDELSSDDATAIRELRHRLEQNKSFLR